VAETEHVVKAHILPVFGERRISDLNRAANRPKSS
jgi:hypothetical protein